MGKLALVLFICILPWGFWKMNFSGICWKQYRKDKKIFLYLLRRVYRKASLHTKWPWTVAGKLCNQLDTKPKSQTQASPIAWLGYGQAKWARKWARKKNPTDKRHRSSKQMNVASTARDKLERKRKTWSKSRTRTNYPRCRAPIPSGDFQRENLAKEAHQPLRSFQLSSPTQSRTGPPSANERTCLLEQSISMAGTSSSVKVPFLVVCVYRGSRGPTLRPLKHLTALPIYFCHAMKLKVYIIYKR